MNPVMDATKATHHGQTAVQDPGQQLRCSCNPGFQLPPVGPRARRLRGSHGEWQLCRGTAAAR